jgi:hypothetical protein
MAAVHYSTTGLHKFNATLYHIFSGDHPDHVQLGGFKIVGYFVDGFFILSCSE